MSSKPTPRRSSVRPRFARMVARALLLRCPWCGGRRAWLKGWFGRYDRCRTCGLQWDRRLVGFELGSTTINVILTLGTILVSLVVGFMLTMPEVAVVPILLVSLGVGLFMPPLAYPFTQTLWLAVDLLMRMPDDDELADWALASAAEPGTYRARSRQY